MDSSHLVWRRLQNFLGLARFGSIQTLVLDGHVSLYQCFLTIKTRSKRCASTLGFLVEWWTQKTSEKIPQNLQGSTSQVSISRRTKHLYYISLFFIRKTRLMHKVFVRTFKVHLIFIIFSDVSQRTVTILFVLTWKFGCASISVLGRVFSNNNFVLTVSELPKKEKCPTFASFACVC